MKEQIGILFTWDWLETLYSIPSTDAIKLIKAMAEYQKDGIEPQFTKTKLRQIWNMVKPTLTNRRRGRINQMGSQLPLEQNSRCMTPIPIDINLNK